MSRVCEHKSDLADGDDGQLKKVVQVDGCAVLLEPEMTMLQDLLLGNRPIRPGPMMRPVAHIARHVVLDGFGYQMAALFIMCGLCCWGNMIRWTTYWPWEERCF
ncbi:hypothetical protein [Puniceicoccus vermicola]|uniref:Uncharacterized protein n=1 Tax=Puniceicoccus vermicola TaxID=388746 RepID=A0A7X1E4I5_9BACT|nr:hypothetical protein [Puniceicoccus vermicola]MBC2602585.1 hypothetical protein [Puniceicoccus vermicola]